MAVTIAYDRAAGGWTSEFSFSQMNGGISLNNNFYTFFRGEIWRHNDASRPYNTFYNIFTPTEIVFIFNDDPSTVKNFKTINFEGNGGWDLNIQTDQEIGSIGEAQFVDKEGKQFAWIRGNENRFEGMDLKVGNVKGAGQFQNPNVSDGIGTFELANIPNSLAQGDIIYRSTISGTSGGTPELVGRVQSISGNTITLGDKTGIEQDANGNLRTFFTPTTNDLCLYIKNNVVEKSGLIGFFATVTMTNDSATSAELFSVGTEVFVSSN